ncbi:MAG: hypothetical protein IJ273_00305 [Alphaproteobacteria bacterium]|nr:hypothetical protein [Alphaproteobacteria bacterium]
MPNLNVGLGVVIGSMYCGPALAIYCTVETETNSNTLSGCADSRYAVYKTARVPTCLTCSSGYKRVSNTVTNFMNECDLVTYSCEECAGCSDCTSDTSWSAAGTGYQKKTTRTCNCETCTESTSYRCAARYYGSSSNGTSGCVSCPPHGNATANSNAGTTSVTGCYIGTGWTWDFSNDIGSGTERFSSACYFSI